MNQQVATLGLELPHTRPRVIYYVALVKPRVLTMILVATLTGLYLGSTGHFDLRLALDLVLGTAMAAGGTLSLNQYMERDLDARMERTRHRPLPAGNLHPAEALWFGIALAAAGFAYLYFAVNGPCAAVTGAITVTYLAIYTPLKRVSSLCTAVGAIPGALPPVAGWAATRGSIGAPAWILFAVIYLWQLPHTLAIAQLYRDDYNRAGIHLLGTEDPNGRATGGQMVINTLVLMVVAVGHDQQIVGVSRRRPWVRPFAAGFPECLFHVFRLVEFLRRRLVKGFPGERVEFECVDGVGISRRMTAAEHQNTVIMRIVDHAAVIGHAIGAPPSPSPSGLSRFSHLARLREGRPESIETKSAAPRYPARPEANSFTHLLGWRIRSSK